uniref:NADH-ubiquinone oxidoreductase chain 2 n=1 Tax=Laccoptera ruginosa TaxID=1205597 RepID=A0A0S2MNY6_9CUCU|nr:NADH deshydrogenase subunit 2 [Laccoptera ruginosa]
MNKFYKISFFNFLMMSTLITISSYSWFMMWLGVEMNLMFMIPIMMKKNNNYSSEAMMKYFFNSKISLNNFNLLFVNNSNSNLKMNYMVMILQFSIIMKLGMAPFHFWLPEVMEGLTWKNCLIMLTWQKIGPMIMLMMTLSNSIFVTFSILISSLLSGIQGLNQISMRKILAYSSINHMAWMTMSMMSSSYIWMIYFLIYSMGNLNLILFFNSMKIFVINQINSINLNKMWKILILVNFMSLGGIPPFIGFLPKWLTIHTLIMNYNSVITMILIMTTLMHMYFYIRIMLPSLILKSKETKMKMKFWKPISLNFVLINTTFLLSLPIMNLSF